MDLFRLFVIDLLCEEMKELHKAVGSVTGHRAMYPWARHTDTVLVDWVLGNLRGKI